MVIEGERGTENPSQVPPCATGWPVRMVFSTIAFNRKRGHLCVCLLEFLRKSHHMGLAYTIFKYSNIPTSLVDLILSATALEVPTFPKIPRDSQKPQRPSEAARTIPIKLVWFLLLQKPYQKKMHFRLDICVFCVYT